MVAEDDEVVFNGLDGSTGGYLQPPTSVAALAAAIRDEQLPGDKVNELRYHNRQPHFGVVFGVDPEDLGSAGWAIVAATDARPEVLEALSVLRDMRREQAGDRYREFVGADGYRRPEGKRDFLARQKMGSALPANPERVPYYVLLVGGPGEIPFSFQYQLDVQYAVGRVAFDTVEEYRRYARAVVAGEDAGVARGVRLFGPRGAGDRATQLSATRLVAPLGATLAQQEPQWTVGTVPPEESRKAVLGKLLSEEDTGLLFTASHGVGFPPGDRRQRDAQGALVCQDWAGPLLSPGELATDTYFAGPDAAALADVRTRVMMSFACFGAGTPLRDDFAHVPGVPNPAIAETPFVARLPQRLLAHPSGGLLAFVGHVERAWGCSFISPKVGAQHDVFSSTLRALMAGWRVGHAMDYFNDRYSALTAELHEVLDVMRQAAEEPDDAHLTRLWTENNDARSYLVLGDPAVRLCGGD